MKTRSEVLREKRLKETAASPTPTRVGESAAERTQPMFIPTELRCGACGHVGKSAEMTKREDGTLECGSCGAPVANMAGPITPATKSNDDAKPAPAQAPPPKEKTKGPKTMLREATADNPDFHYCGECASDWPIVDGKPFRNCGHPKAVGVADPRHAVSRQPPAGLQTRTEKAAEAPMATAPATPPGGPTMTITPLPGGGKRLSLHWGEARCAVDQWNNFKCGGHIVTLDVPEGEDVVAVAEKTINDLERIADMLFARQLAWYTKKLGILSKLES